MHRLRINIAETAIQHVVAKDGSLKRTHDRNEDCVERRIHGEVNCLLYLIYRFARETDHEETGHFDVVLPRPQNRLLRLVDFQVLPDQPLVLLRCGFNGDRHEVRSGLLHQSDQLFIEAIAADAVRELQMNLQSTLHNPAADLLGPFEVEIENVVDHHEFFDAMVLHEVFHLIQHFGGRQTAIPFAVNRVAVRTLVRTAAA